MILIFVYYWLQGPIFHFILNVLPFLNSNLSPFIIFMGYYRHQLYLLWLITILQVHLIKKQIITTL